MIKETQNFFSLLGIAKNPLQKNGVLTQKYGNGKIKIQGNVISGFREGVWKFYYKNGDIYASGKYIKGKKHGSWIFYHQNRRIVIL